MSKKQYVDSGVIHAIRDRIEFCENSITAIERQAKRDNKDVRSVPQWDAYRTELARLNKALRILTQDYI